MKHCLCIYNCLVYISGLDDHIHYLKDEHGLLMIMTSQQSSRFLSTVIMLNVMIVLLGSLLYIQGWKPTVPATAYTITRHSSEYLAIHLVTIPFMGYTSNNAELIHKREQEYLTVLQRNLDHDKVFRVHVLMTAHDAEDSPNKFAQFNHSKLVISEVPSVEFSRSAFDYISENLVGQIVMFLNADIYLGSGFDKVDPVWLRERKMMYALTRHEKKEESCEGDYCSQKRYGSEDAFLFHLKEPIPEEFLKDLEFTVGSWGSENVLMWVFKRMGFCITNPCEILQVFHLHCSNIRNPQKRVNRNGKSIKAHITKQLTC